MVSETISASRQVFSPRIPIDVPDKIIGATSGLVLRYARDDDAPAIIALISSVWSEYPGKKLVAAADMPELLHPASTYGACDGRFWVVEAHGEIVGTVALQPSQNPDVVELQKLYVAQSLRRNGLGSFLCHLVEREARRRGAHAIELWSDIKLLDAHRRYERLGYVRGETLKTYNDTSATVRYYYRKPLDPELPDHPDLPPEASDRWQELLLAGAAGGVRLRNSFVRHLSFTEHPASVGESYFEHLRQAMGFGLSMLAGAAAVLVHAVLPFLFTKTASGIIARLYTRMVIARRRPAVQRSVGRPSATAHDKRASAA